MKYNVRLLFYSSLDVEVEANDEEEAQILAQSKALDDKDYLEIGKIPLLVSMSGASIISPFFAVHAASLTAILGGCS